MPILPAKGVLEKKAHNSGGIIQTLTCGFDLRTGFCYTSFTFKYIQKASKRTSHVLGGTIVWAFENPTDLDTPALSFCNHVFYPHQDRKTVSSKSLQN